VGNALFKPILQCVSRYTATRLVSFVSCLNTAILLSDYADIVAVDKTI